MSATQKKSGTTPKRKASAAARFGGRVKYTATDVKRLSKTKPWRALTPNQQRAVRQLRAVKAAETRQENRAARLAAEQQAERDRQARNAKERERRARREIELARNLAVDFDYAHRLAQGKTRPGELSLSELHYASRLLLPTDTIGLSKTAAKKVLGDVRRQRRQLSRVLQKRFTKDEWEAAAEAIGLSATEGYALWYGG